MNTTLLFRYTLLAGMYHGVCTPLEAAARKNPYQINTQVVHRQGKVKDADVTITFTFSYRNEMLTVKRFVELSKHYDVHLQATMVELTRAICEQADAYMLWDGFATTAQLASQDANRPFTIIMRGRCQPDKRDPKDRGDRFMQYDEKLPVGKYDQVRAKSMDVRFVRAFDEHIATALQQDKDAQNVVFTSPSGRTLLAIPMMEATTIYDVGKEATDAQIISYWRMILAVLHRYGALVQCLRFNTGGTYAGQTVPHVHVRFELGKAFSKKKSVVGWEANGKVTFQTL